MKTYCGLVGVEFTCEGIVNVVEGLRAGFEAVVVVVVLEVVTSRVDAQPW